MPLAQFRNDPKGINVSRRMFSPKKISSMQHWLRAARKKFPEMPQENSDWTLAEADSSVRYVKFTFVNNIGERCHLVIDRTQPSLGA